MTPETPDGEETEDPGFDAAQSGVPKPDSPLGKVIMLLGVVFALGAVVQIYYQPIITKRYVNLHLMFAFIIFFLVELYRRLPTDDWSLREWASMGLFGAITLGAVVATTYVHFMFVPLTQDRFASRYPFHEVIIGAVLIVAAIYALYRAFGLMISGVTVFVLLYGRFGPLFPGILEHGGVGWERLILYNSLGLEGGTYHLLVSLVATWVFVFIIWAGLVEEYGGLELFFDVGFLIASRFKSGVAQTAVVTSMIMGSINGSPMANAVVTGSFTIPLMKERGFPGRTAAAVESVASTGGMILPPVMGTVAFLMANFLNVSYAHIVTVAALPAILFYAAVALSVHLISVDVGADMRIEREVDAWATLRGLVPIIVSLAALIYLLLVASLDPGLAGVGTILTLVGAQFLQTSVIAARGGSGQAFTQALWTFGLETARGFRTGSVRIVPISLAVAAIGVVVSTFTLTNLGFRLSLGLVEVAGGNIFILLFLVMIASIVLGMGMPTVAAYLVTITLVAPALTEVGFAQITAHFFVFYFAMLASITPPIALAPAVTSKIARADFVQTSISSMILGLPLFVLPYVFAFNQSILQPSGLDTVVAFGSAFVGFIVLVFAIHGRSLDLRIWEYGDNRAIRAIVAVFGLAIVFTPFFLNGQVL
jgi:TRAP transporter 4TM/12TM fusion protein